ncbi:MAG TPA: hypothetical protein VF771_09505 [Longimicrobiaceae bacterium]
MRKLKLDLDKLQVDTFETAEEGRGAGTVEAFRVRAVTGYPLSCWQSCWPDDTCPGCTEGCATNTCDATCPATCPYSCDTDCGGGGTTDTGPDNTVAY